MTGIRKRVDDALFLWNIGRHETAFLVALVAFAAIARLRYKKLKDGDRFGRLFREIIKVRLNVEYRGKQRPIEHIFYKFIRCDLVHEGALPVDIQFMEDENPELVSVRDGGAPQYVLKIGHGWFHQLIGSIKSTPEYLKLHFAHK